jgi:hypothetical protein
MLMTVVFTAIHRRGRRPAAQPETGRHHLAARVPFLFSVVLAAVGPWVRYRITESPAFIKAKQAQEAEHYVVNMPLLQGFPPASAGTAHRGRRPLRRRRQLHSGNYTAATITCSPCSSWPTSPNTLARPGAPR